MEIRALAYIMVTGLCILFQITHICFYIAQYFTVSIFGNDPNESKFYSGRNQEQTEVGECLLSISAESSIFQFANQKNKC